MYTKKQTPLYYITNILINYKNKETSKFVDLLIVAVLCILGSRELNFSENVHQTPAVQIVIYLKTDFYIDCA